jgi:hypothetical protein
LYYKRKAVVFAEFLRGVLDCFSDSGFAASAGCGLKGQERLEKICYLVSQVTPNEK